MINEKIVNFLETNPEFSSRIIEKLQLDQSLVEAGILDSFGVIALITFLEETFNFRAVAEDLSQENFETINSITQFVEKKISGQ